MNYEKFEKELLDVANETVGNVGPDVSAHFINSEGIYNLAYFTLVRKPLFDQSDVIKIWSDWITAYCSFMKLHRFENAILLEDPDLIIRWQIEPEVVTGHPSFSGLGKVLIRAWLVISRVDYKPLRLNREVSVPLVFEER